MDLNDFIFFLQGKYRDKSDLEDLRGKKVIQLTQELAQSMRACEEKDQCLMELFNQNNTLSQTIERNQEKHQQEMQALS